MRGFLLSTAAGLTDLSASGSNASRKAASSVEPASQYGYHRASPKAEFDRSPDQKVEGG
jgi:hypothetical protein